MPRRKKSLDPKVIEITNGRKRVRKADPAEAPLVQEVMAATETSRMEFIAEMARLYPDTPTTKLVRHFNRTMRNLLETSVKNGLAKRQHA